ncbi:MAG: hypothetical protein GY832_45105 [Chloroflexi bacterium]|nr:hypothetical protein [Chloroflexota bacterium]
MTITNTTIRASTNGDGTTTSFAVAYPFYDASNLVVILVNASGVETTQTLGTHYTVTGGAGSTGTVEMITAPASGERLVRYRKLPITQETDYADGDAFPADSHEAALDRLTMQNQEQADKLSRAVTLSESTTATGDLIMAEPAAGRALKWNATADGIINSIDDVDGIVVAAQSAKTDAETAKGLAETYRNSADTFKSQAEGFKNEAENARDTAVAAAAGIYWKEPTAVATTGNITLSGEQTIDGIVTSTSRVLVKNQSAAAENGIYVSAAGVWARSTPLDTWDEHVGATVTVTQGAAHADTSWMCMADPGGTLGTTPITWSGFGTSAMNQNVDNYTDGADFTAGTTTALNLSTAPGSENNVAVTFDGITQHHDTFTVSSTTVTFDAAIPFGTNNVEARYGTTIGIGIPSDGTVSVVKLVNNAVETAKIKDGAVTIDKLAAGAGSIVGEIRMWCTGTPPTGWLDCNASAVSRATYSGLFAVIGTTFGVGDGSTTFNLPDFRGRTPVGVGTGDASDATAFALADKDGAETHTLTIAEMPAHTHSARGATVHNGSANANTQSGESTTGSTGGDGAHNNLQPSLGIHFIIKA